MGLSMNFIASYFLLCLRRSAMKRLDETQLPGVHFFEIPKFTDDRGWLMELFRTDELEFAPEMAYLSMTEPDVMRGPHEHEYQTDFFVFIGPGEFELHLWGEELFQNDMPGGQNDKPGGWRVHEVHQVGESRPRAVVVPPGIIHGYQCVSTFPGLVFNAPDMLYAGPARMYPVDEIRHEDHPNRVKRLLEL
jgi:dTDP-4-dehydrorhamnose 3,5-epimerase